MATRPPQKTPYPITFPIINTPNQPRSALRRPIQTAVNPTRTRRNNGRGTPVTAAVPSKTRRNIYNSVRNRRGPVYFRSEPDERSRWTMRLNSERKVPLFNYLNEQRSSWDMPRSLIRRTLPWIQRTDKMTGEPIWSHASRPRFFYRRMPRAFADSLGIPYIQQLKTRVNPTVVRNSRRTMQTRRRINPSPSAPVVTARVPSIRPSVSVPTPNKPANTPIINPVNKPANTPVPVPLPAPAPVPVPIQAPEPKPNTSRLYGVTPHRFGTTPALKAAPVPMHPAAKPVENFSANEWYYGTG